MVGVHYFLAAAAIVAAVAAWFDWRTGHIPDWVSLAPLPAGPIAHAVVAIATGNSHDAIQAAGFSVLGAAVCAIVPIIQYRVGAIGGGDVKLLAGIGALLGWRFGIEAEFYAFVAAAIIAPARLAYEGKLFRVLGNTVALIANPFRPKDKRRQITPEMMTWFRMGPAIFVGVCGVFVLGRPE
jgi:prepilin peptidase CpaA